MRACGKRESPQFCWSRPAPALGINLLRPNSGLGTDGRTIQPVGHRLRGDENSTRHSWSGVVFEVSTCRYNQGTTVLENRLISALKGERREGKKWHCVTVRRYGTVRYLRTVGLGSTIRTTLPLHSPTIYLVVSGHLLYYVHITCMKVP